MSITISRGHFMSVRTSSKRLLLGREGSLGSARVWNAWEKIAFHKIL